MSLFLTREQFANLKKDRPLALYGLGSIADATRRQCKREIAWLVDIEVGLGGSLQGGVPILDVADLEQLSPPPYYVICTCEIEQAVNQLRRCGLKPRRDFAVTPLLADQQAVVKLKRARGRLLLASGAAAVSESPGGGGLYELRFNASGSRLRKIRSGPIYGVIPFGKVHLAIDPRRGILEFDEGFCERVLVPLPAVAWCHGIAHCPETKTFWVTATQLDQVWVFNENFEKIDAINLSDRLATSGNWGHHPNDIIIDDGSALVSMFSLSGLWRKGVIDGAVVEIDTRTRRMKQAVIENLWMPHNPTFIKEELVVADSFRGLIKRSGQRVLARFPGYARGLASDGTYIYAGQGPHRNYRKLGSMLELASMDTCVHIVDEAAQLSRTIALSTSLTDIHTILPLPVNSH